MKVTSNQKGFTLLEIIVVLAVLGALAAMLSPAVFRYIEDGNRARAQNDVRQIANAIQRFYADTGRWPLYKDGNGATAIAAADADYLTSESTCDPNDADLATCDTELPTAGAGWTYADDADSLERQLLENNDLGGMNDEPYATTGSKAWRGPYVDGIPDVDPWGRSYLVNIGGVASGLDYAVIAISAGPDGILQTAGNTANATNLSAAGDDIIARVK